MLLINPWDILNFFQFSSEKMEKRACNHLFWSPSGQFIVMAGLTTMSGALEFIDTNDFTSMNLTDHYQTSDVEWDPTGRYVSFLHLNFQF